jgi:hypothetical protein
VPIIFLTAYGQDQGLIEGYDSGAVDFRARRLRTFCAQGYKEASMP